jgi:uncharacterized protein (DUF1778 family)
MSLWQSTHSPRPASAKEEMHNIRLSIEDQQRFVELLLNPPPLSPAMKRAKAAHARLILESP